MSKSEPKGAKRVAIGVKREPKGSQSEPKGRQNASQNSSPGRRHPGRVEIGCGCASFLDFIYLGFYPLYPFAIVFVFILDKIL